MSKRLPPLPPEDQPRECCRCKKPKYKHFFGPKTWAGPPSQRVCSECVKKGKPKQSRLQISLGVLDRIHRPANPARYRLDTVRR